jgi:protein-disulfide isomerase
MTVYTRLALVAFAVLSLAGCNKPSGGAVSADEMSLGDPKAKVTMIEYASVACPICAHFNNEVFPEFKRKYVDTGKVRYVSREALTGNPTLAASGFLLARCAGKDKYFQVTDAVYRAQDEIYEPGTETVRPGDGRDVLLRIAKGAGLSEDQFNKCVGDETALKALADRVEKFSKQDNVDATPTFIVNGKVLRVGDISMSDLDAAMAPLVGSK